MTHTLNSAAQARRQSRRTTRPRDRRRSGIAAMTLGVVVSALTMWADSTPAEAETDAVPPTVWAWGSNDYGQMLDVLTRERSTPVPVLNNVTDFALGDSLGAAVVEGRVWTWGGPPNFGSTPSLKETSTPRRVPGLADVAAVSVGDDHFVAVDTTGHVWAWGAGDQGQLGLGSAGSASTPTRLDTVTPGLPAFVDVEAGYQYSLAVDATGQVWTWGRELMSLPGSPHTPRQVPGAANVRDVHAGFNHALARTDDGHVLGWGANFYGQLGQGSIAGATGVVTIPGLSDVTAVAAGGDTNLAVNNGTTLLWGQNFGQFLADAPDSITTPTPVPGLPPGAAVAVGQHHAIAVGVAGQAHTWGRAWAALGRPSATPFGLDPAPMPVSGSLPRMVAADAAFFGSMLLDQDGTLYSFGDATNGSLGDTYGRSLTPARIAGVPTGTVEVSSGKYHALALAGDGQVYAWGENSLNQVGPGASLFTTPQHVDIPVPVARVQAGWRSSFALDTTGTVWAWGRNRGGQLGDGTTTQRATPVPVDLPDPVTDLDSGAFSTIAVDSTGQVWTWGGNSSGELGTGDEEEQLTPYSVPLPDQIVDVAAGEEHAAALAADGTVWTTGWNHEGQLGGLPPQEPNRRPTFEPVPGLPDNLTAIAAGDAQTVALTDDGTVWEWGRVLPDRTGTGTPAPVDGLPPMSQVAAGGNVRIGLSTTGGVWVWGDNVEGDLATGDTAAVAEPRRLTGFAGATSVQVSKDHQNNTVFVLAGPTRTTTAHAAGGDTVSTGAAVSAQDPVQLSVSTPINGDITITEDATVTLPGLSLLGVPFDVTAPNASAADPLVLTFTLHSSAIPAGTALADIRPVRNGAIVADCAASAGASATPDPCVAARSKDPFGNVHLTVRTSHASTWALVKYQGPPPLPPLVSIGGISDGAVLTLNQRVPLTVTCTDRGIAVTSCQVRDRADTSAVGVHTVVARAVDETGIETTTSLTYQVQYAFSGYDDRVVPAPSVNVGKAGRTYPLGWTLYDADRTPQASPAAVKSIRARSVPCGQFDLTTGDALDTTAAGSSGLRVQADGSFAYNWKTPTAAGCYRVEVNLADGTAPWLAFQLR